MKFGVAKDIITPDVSIGMSGYGSRYGKSFQTIHDDLYVRCIFLQNQNNPLLMISFDLAFHDFELTETIRDYVKKAYDLPKQSVVLSYTHTHAGPAVIGFSPGESCPAYERMLVERTKSCIDRCMLNVQKGSMSFCQIEGDWNMNRRKLVDGKLVGGPYPEGATDKVMNVCIFRDHTGKIRAIVFNYACHPVTLNDTWDLSAEYPGRVCQILQSHYYGCTPIFFQGAGAHERPKIAFREGTWIKCSFEQVNEMALQMASRIESAIANGQFEEIDPSLDANTFDMDVPIQPFDKQMLEEQARGARGFTKNAISAILDGYDQKPDHLTLHGGTVKLTDTLYLAWLSGEVVTEVKDLIHRALGTDKKLLFIGYADSVGYIPDQTVIEQGGYEGGLAMIGFSQKGTFTPMIDHILTEHFQRAFSKLN